MEKLEETLMVYDRDVDRYAQKLEFQLPKEDLNTFIKMLNGKTVLDAGCGAGRDSTYLSKQGLEVIGIDMSEKMLDAARERTNIDFRKMDIRETSFSDKHFEGIWCYNTLLHLDQENLHKTLKEFSRIIKNKGILFIATKLGEGEISKQSDKGTKYFFLYNEDYLIDLLQEYKFEIISTRRYKQKDESFIDILAKMSD